MNRRRGSAAVVSLAIILVVAIAAAGAGFYFLQKERATNAGLQAELEDLKAQQTATQNQLQQQKKRAEDLEAQLLSAKTQSDKLSAELQAEKGARQEAVSRIEQMRVDLEQQKALRTDIENKLSQSQDDLRKIQAQASQLDGRKKELEERIKLLEGQTADVQLGNIVVTPDAKVIVPSAPPTPAKIEKAAASSGGTVLLVNRDYDFVVVSYGSKDAVTLGAVLSIYRDQAYLGDVKIEKLHESMSAAGFVTAGLKDKVREGDRVVKKGK